MDKWISFRFFDTTLTTIGHDKSGNGNVTLI